jgi:Xaa-Pro aminopeptidase
MQADLDRLMSDKQLDVLIVEGADGLSEVSAPWRYLTRGQKMTGYVIKKRGEPAMVLYHLMEQQQAEATGLKLVSYGKWDLKSIAKNSASRLDSATELWRQIFRDLELAGRVAWYGATEAASLLALIDALRKHLPGAEFVGEYENSVIDVARRTKDADEIAAMQDVGKRTCEVVQDVVDFIKRQTVNKNILVDAKGWPVTIGHVKQFIRRACDDLDLDVGDPIFAQGSDAGIPHAHGDPTAPLSLGDPIVFDIYPKCRKTGYYHDMTRTFAIGYASDELKKVYDDVKHAFDTILREFKAGTRCKVYQDRCCQLLRESGHVTIEEKWPLEEGYTHSLGHGLGLEVHEPLAFSSFADRGDTLQPGNVFTLEPGLYYPKRGIGVRLEDTIVCDTDGSFRSITPFGFDWVIEVGK